MNTSTIKKSFVTLGLVTAGLIASNVYLAHQVATLKDEAIVESDIARLKDSVMALESADLSSLSLPEESLTQFLMDNPTAIVKSLAKYRFEQEQIAKQKEAENIKRNLDSLVADVNDPYIGNPNGKYVLVEFADYNCGYCKRLGPVLEEVVRLSDDVKVIIKEYPIFDNLPSSKYSAVLATALFYHNNEKYEKFHHLLMSTKLESNSVVDSLLAQIGVDKAALEPYMDKATRQVEKNRTLGVQLKVQGTPTLFFNGQKLSTGYSPEEFIAIMKQEG